MADIIINGPEGTSTINNIPAWATAAGQVSVENVLKGMATETTKMRAFVEILARGSKVTSKNNKETQKRFKELAKEISDADSRQAKSQEKQSQQEKAATKELSSGLKDLSDLQADGLRELANLNKHTSQQNTDLDKILKDMNNSSDGLFSLAGAGAKGGFAIGLAVDAITAAAGVFGTVVLTAANYIKNEFLDVFRFYNNSLTAGTGSVVGLTKSVENVAFAANLAGMSLDEFGTFAQSNSKILRTLGARGFADLYSKSLLASDGLLQLGFTSEDALSAMMTELEYRRRFGMVIQQGSNNLQGSLLASVKQIRTFAQAVGMSEDELRNNSTINEEYVDQLRAVGIRAGAGGEEIANKARTISNTLAALGLEDAINPIFESLSKGSTGLSDSFMQLGVAFPDLIPMIDRAAIDFKQNGTLNANLGKEIAMTLRNMNNIDIGTLEALFDAGEPGAAAVLNLAKNIEKLSEDQIQDLGKELDYTRLSMLNTFNKLGYIVNQGTSSIGDFGKTMLISAMGFDEAADGTVNFSEGITDATDVLKNFIGNTFGRESGIYEAVEHFSEYMTTMFGGKKNNESQQQYEARLDEARTLFVGTINTFAQDLGLDLNNLLTSGSIASTVSKFFADLMDQLALSIHDATGGMLFGEKVDSILSRQLAAGNIGANQFNERAGSWTGNETDRLTATVIGDNIRNAFDTAGVGAGLSSSAGRTDESKGNIASGSEELVEKFGMAGYRKLIGDLIDDMSQFDEDFYTNSRAFFDFDGTKGGWTQIKDDLDEDQQQQAEAMLKLMQQRYITAVNLNKDAYRMLTDFSSAAEENNINLVGTRGISKIGEGFAVQTVLRDFGIDKKEIGTGNNTKQDQYNLETFLAEIGQMPSMTAIDPNATINRQLLFDEIQNYANPLAGFSGSANGQPGAYAFNSIGKNKSAYFDKDSNASADIKQLGDKLATFMTDGLNRDETKELNSMLKSVSGRYDNLSPEDKAMLTATQDLVDRVSELTNQLSKYIKNDGADNSNST